MKRLRDMDGDEPVPAWVELLRARRGPDGADGDEARVWRSLQRDAAPHAARPAGLRTLKLAVVAIVASSAGGNGGRRDRAPLGARARQGLWPPRPSTPRRRRRRGRRHDRRRR